MPNTILVGLRDYNYTQAHIDKLQTLAPDKKIVITRDEAEVKTMLDDIEIVVGDIPREMISQAKNLRWLQQWFAGANWILDYPDLQTHDFTLTNASGVHAIPITEHIFALLLAFARDIHNGVRAQSQNHWLGHHREDVFELANKTMLIIGVGAIGQRTAEVAAVMGMHVIGLRRNPQKTAPHVEAMYGPAQLLDVLPQADFVVLTIPATPETMGFINAEALQAMKSTAYIVNIGRGDTIDETALAHALQTGQIAGAGLDVFEKEPLPADSPLWGLKNCIITAHYSGQTPQYDERAWDIFYDNVQRYVAGQPLRNVVDKQLGY